MPREPEEYDDFDDSFQNDCWNCAGEGFVSDCWEEYACLDPEGGCDLCTRRCDVCQPATPKEMTDGN